MFETSRLHVHPLTHAQLLQCVRIDHSLEQALQLKPIPRNISSELKESEQVMVADLCIMGEPNKDGAIEIGYGTYEAFQGQGFMTELVGGIVSWAREEPSVKSIKAATDKPILHRSGCWKRMAF